MQELKMSKHKKINNPLLQEISDFVGLPLEIYDSSITEVENTIIQLINKEDATKNHGK